MTSIEPRNFKQAEKEENYTLAKKEKLNQFTMNKVRTLVRSPKDHQIIGSKWVFKNKLDEQSDFVKNKAGLVAKWYF